MIYKPDVAPYRSLIFGTLLCAVIAGLTYWAFFYRLTYGTADGASIPMRWEYVKACLNPFDQVYCRQIKATLSPDSERRFYQGTITFAAFVVMAMACFVYLVWEWGLRVKPLIIKVGFTVAGARELAHASNNEIKRDARGLHWFGDFSVSRMREVNHFPVFGAIGGGKTQTILPLLRSVMERGDNTIMIIVESFLVQRTHHAVFEAVVELSHFTAPFRPNLLSVHIPIRMLDESSPDKVSPPSQHV